MSFVMWSSIFVMISIIITKIIIGMYYSDNEKVQEFNPPAKWAVYAAYTALGAYAISCISSSWWLVLVLALMATGTPSEQRRKK